MARALAGGTRYRLLETIREFAHERLAEAGELEAARERHLRHFSVPEDEVIPDGWPSLRAIEVLDEIEEDYGNVVAALEWAATSNGCAGAQLLFARRDLFPMLGQADGRRLADLLLERCPARDRHRIELLITAGLLAMLVADVPAAERAHDQASELAVALGEPRLEGWAHFFHGLADTLGGAGEAARPSLTKARELLDRAGIQIGAAHADATLGLTHAAARDTAQAQELLERARAAQTEAGYRWEPGSGPPLPRARRGHRRARLARGPRPLPRRDRVPAPVSDSSLVTVALIGQANALSRRDPARAVKIVAAAWTNRARIGGEFAPLFRAFADRVRTTCEAAVGAEAEAICAQGSRLGVDDAIALASGTRGRTRRPERTRARRRPSGRQRPCQQGDRRRAASFGTDSREPRGHVLAKVGLDNRTQLATWARERIQ